MKKVLLFLLFGLVLLSSPAFSQMFMDGDSSDWQGDPAATWFNNEDALFPAEVGAAVNDIVDIRAIKAKVVGNVLYGFIKVWGGPAWPNEAYQNDHEGTIYPASRGYYKLLLDVDNDITSGWNTAWYEAHYTPVGYLESQSVEGANPIGAEIMLEWGARTRDQFDIDAGGDPIKNLDYWAADYSEYDGQTDTGSDYDIFNLEITDKDSSKTFRWDGGLTNDEAAEGDNRYFWAGHGWGDDFIEFGVELTPMIEYFQNKDGSEVFKEGDVIGVCGHIETPQDDWANDISTRGEFTVPAMPARPNVFAFDGDSTDWNDTPAIINWYNNEDALFPAEVGAAVADIVDIKRVKAIITQSQIYYMIKVWGGPAWPNEVYENDREGTIYTASRGYYHLLLDIDNDITTGWNTAWYEAHYTPVGYLQSQSVEGADPIGAEIMIEWGGRTRDQWEINEGSDAIKNLDYWAADYSEYDGQTDNGPDYEIANWEIYDKDSAAVMSYDGLVLNNSSDDETLLDGQPDWMGHGWGYDFIEVGISLRSIKQYWKNKTGDDIFNVGDVIGINGHIETPKDDWANDFSTRGEVTVVDVATAISNKNNRIVADKFALSNNYPNPFNPETTIEYFVPKTADVSLAIYNTLGQKVRTLVNNSVLPGSHVAKWNGRNDLGNSVPSGIYFYRLETGSKTMTKRMVLLK